MTTPMKPLNKNTKSPIYYKEIVEIYGMSTCRPKTEHNPAEALQELKKHIVKKQTNAAADHKKNKKDFKTIIKTVLVADVKSLNFKKKGIFGKKPTIKNITYDSIRAFYQFADDPTFLVIGIRGNITSNQYIFISSASQYNTTKLVEVLQAAQWAPQNNLKNSIPNVDFKKLDLIDGAPKSATSRTHSRHDNVSESLTSQTYSRHDDVSKSLTSQTYSRHERSRSSSPHLIPSPEKSRARECSRSSMASSPSISNVEPLKSTVRQTPSRASSCSSYSLSRTPTLSKEQSISSSLSEFSKPIQDKKSHFSSPPKGGQAVLLSEGRGYYVVMKQEKRASSNDIFKKRPKKWLNGKPNLSSCDKKPGDKKVTEPPMENPENYGLYLLSDSTNGSCNSDIQPRECRLSSRLYYYSPGKGEFDIDDDNDSPKTFEMKPSDLDLIGPPSRSRSNSSSSSSSSSISSSSVSSLDKVKDQKPVLYLIK